MLFKFYYYKDCSFTKTPSCKVLAVATLHQVEEVGGFFSSELATPVSHWFINIQKSKYASYSVRKVLRHKKPTINSTRSKTNIERRKCSRSRTLYALMSHRNEIHKTVPLTLLLAVPSTYQEIGIVSKVATLEDTAVAK